MQHVIIDIVSEGLCHRVYRYIDRPLQSRQRDDGLCFDNPSFYDSIVFREVLSARTPQPLRRRYIERISTRPSADTKLGRELAIEPLCHSLTDPLLCQRDTNNYIKKRTTFDTKFNIKTAVRARQTSERGRMARTVM
ncbi:hypothetical protein EVAR_46966_1 [Eumeta japonica]|uniref:Uncharacterized protein n=1 Tax=Eumeta variegata TaxID=151549 RepID=A0A4C1YIZ7_EUMVA|nr:hypothetical protein EVAR_46966_1 [Eumeta japonica]